MAAALHAAPVSMPKELGRFCSRKEEDSSQGGQWPVGNLWVNGRLLGSSLDGPFTVPKSHPDAPWTTPGLRTDPPLSCPRTYLCYLLVRALPDYEKHSFTRCLRVYTVPAEIYSSDFVIKF